MNLYPLGDHIVVVPDEVESVRASGLIIPDTAKEKSAKGTVLAVGPGREIDYHDLMQQLVLQAANPAIAAAPQLVPRTIPVSLKVGDVVLYTKYAGSEIKVDDKDYLVLEERNVLLVYARGE